MKKILLIPIFLSGPAYSSWLCKEASSRAMDNIFYACGHALSNSLIEARENSLKAAKREFEAFCNDSSNCKDYAYIISPLRTDCSKEGNKYSCYRGMEYRILTKKKSSMKFDKSELRRLIKHKEEELAELEENIVQIEKLNNLEDKIERIKNVDKAEVEIEYLKSHIDEAYPDIWQRGISVKIVGTGTPLKKDDTSNADSVILGGIGVEYDSPLWRNISSRISLSYLLGREETTLKDRGTADTQSETEFHAHKGFDGNLALPIVFNQFTLSPTLGYVAISYKSTQYNYNNFGIGLDKTEKSYNYNSGYVGLGFRYGRKLFIELEPRQYIKDSKSALSASLGMRIEF